MYEDESPADTGRRFGACNHGLVCVKYLISEENEGLSYIVGAVMRWPYGVHSLPTGLLLQPAPAPLLHSLHCNTLTHLPTPLLRH